MRLFISEYICGGAWPEAEFPASLREGGAMLGAVAADAARLPGVEVVVLWDHRLPPLTLPGVNVLVVQGADEESRLFDRYAAECDGTLVIAPEFAGILAQRSERVATRGGRLLGCAPSAVRLTADKLALSTHLQAAGIRTIPTATVRECIAAGDGDGDGDGSVRHGNAVFQGLSFPVVIKPRDGAGSQETWLLRDAASFQEWLSHAAPATIDNAICQTYIQGRTVSVVVLVHDDGCEAWPVCEQVLSTEGRFNYLGGVVPAEGVDGPALQALANNACATVAGLHGYVGVDLIESANGPVVVEINPRLTTSYLGYRALAGENLLSRMLFPQPKTLPVDWKKTTIRFDSAGNLQSAIDSEFA